MWFSSRARTVLTLKSGSIEVIFGPLSDCSAGPYGPRGQVAPLAPAKIFELPVRHCPVIWKTSCLLPVPKMPQPNGFSDYQPVALTSLIVKTLERLVLEQLRPVVRPHLDPLQFAYQPRIGVEDAIIYVLNRVYAHLDKPMSTVRVTFFDFSTAFNAIRPALLGDKLMAMLVDPPLCPGLWITSLADHSLCACGTVCQMQWSATPGPHKGLSSLLSSSPFTPLTSATRQSLAIFRSFLMTLL